jgi:organic hydroperoxide reductase OsmC/OhrA
MAADHHDYRVAVTWTGNLGSGTSAYRAYSRDHQISAGGKPDIPCSSDPAFRGDASRYNPEELLVASLSQCHMLWFLHLCAESGIAVTSYRDSASGRMVLNPDGSGQFKHVILDPQIETAAPAPREKIAALHHRAHQLCFIGRSVAFPVTIKED